jgi:hypothetical protein
VADLRLPAEAALVITKGGAKARPPPKQAKAAKKKDLQFVICYLEDVYNTEPVFVEADSQRTIAEVHLRFINKKKLRQRPYQYRALPLREDSGADPVRGTATAGSLKNRTLIFKEIAERNGVHVIVSDEKRTAVGMDLEYGTQVGATVPLFNRALTVPLDVCVEGTGRALAPDTIIEQCRLEDGARRALRPAVVPVTVFLGNEFPIPSEFALTAMLEAIVLELRPGSGPFTFSRIEDDERLIVLPEIITFREVRRGARILVAKSEARPDEPHRARLEFVAIQRRRQI